MALLIGAGTPAAWAASCVHTISAGFNNPAAHTTANVCVQNTSFTGNITNEGTISPSGIALVNGTITGQVFSTGVINGGISIDSHSAITSTSAAILFTGPTLTGGISNAGRLTGGFVTDADVILVQSASLFSGNIVNSGSVLNSSSADGIEVENVSKFSGGITNSGLISVGGTGISVEQVSLFTGDITNSGTISANGTGANGISVINVSTFGGRILNSGTITAGSSANGISVTRVSTFLGGITNSGTIFADQAGIFVDHVGSFGGDVVNAAGGTITGGRAGIVIGNNLGGNAISLFSGNVINAGMISAQSSGILVNGVSTFTGSIINKGTIVGASTSAIRVENSGTFSGAITNSGTISNVGAGIGVTFVTAFGTNSAGGGIVNTSLIVANSVGIRVADTATFMGGITNLGTITVGRTGISIVGVASFIGNVSNNGTISAGSAGIFVCNCATFVGGTIANSGSITAHTGILVHNFAPVNIFNSGTIVGTGGTAVDLTGAFGGNTFTLGPGYSITGNVLASITGTDTFQLGGVGSDSFDLSSVGATKRYRNFGVFNVVSGIWTVSNVFGQTQGWNILGGTLAGTGTLPAINVNNGGTLEPGNIGAPGTFMTVTGNLTFQPGAIYLVNISPTAASRVNVGGAVSLNGAVDGLLAPGSYSTKTTYDILDPSSITGKFTGFTAINAPGFGGTLTYNGNTDVLLNLTAQLGSGGGLNVNQQNVANAINTFFNNGGTLPASFFPLFTLTGSNLANGLSRVDGEVATDADHGAFQLMNQFLNLMLDPYVDGRTGIFGGAPLGFAPDQQASLPPDIALAYAGVLKAPPKQTFDERWTAWGAAFGGTNKTNGDPVVGSNTVTASDYGFAAGMDYRASPDTILGFALAGGGTGWSVAQGLGTGRSDAFMAGAYGTTYWGPAYLAGAVAFANHWLTTNRVVFGDQLTANFSGQDFAARAEAGYRYTVPFQSAEIGIAPYAALQTQWFHTPTYNENDLTGGGLGLTYGAATVNDTRSEVGARFDDLTTLHGKPLMLRARLAWAHDWVSNPAQSAAFQALPGASFMVNGAPFASDSALTTASAELRFAPRWSLSAKFDGEFAAISQTYAGTAMLRYAW